jgi:hypothetical protein
MATPEMEHLQTLTPEVCLVIEPKPAPASRLLAFLESAKKFSDLGIAVPALLYTCGFVVLGCYAEDNGLGLQLFPAIQFFSAGAGFLIIFCSIVLLVMALRQLLKKVFEWLSSAEKLSRLVKKALPWLLMGSLALNGISGVFHLHKLYMVSVYGIIAAVFFSAEGFAQQMARLYLYFIGFVAGLAFLALYAFSAYPRIPASFGGGKPRHAQIQFDAKAIAGDLSARLVQSGQISASGIATLEADVYLITDNNILIKVRRLEPLSQNSRPPAMVVQLRRSDVSAIFWDSPR